MFAKLTEDDPGGSASYRVKQEAYAKYFPEPMPEKLQIMNMVIGTGNYLDQA